MSAGAVTLQCSSCGGVFLTLQQGGILEICPHCAVSALRESYHPTDAAVGARARTELPTKRETISPVLPDVFFPQTPTKSGHHVDDQTPAPPAPAVFAESAPVVTDPPVAPPVSSPQSEVRAEVPAAGSARPFGIDPPLKSAGLPGRKNLLGVISFLMLSCLAGAVVWLATKKQDSIVVPQTEPVPPPKAVQKPAVQVAVTPPKPDAQTQEEIVLRARADDVHMANLVDAMVKGLDAAKTTDERLPFVDQPENHRAEVERFFASNGGRLDLVRIEPSVGSIIILPSGDEEKLFKLTTKKCPDGAIIRIMLKNDKATLHWPVFEQSHDYLFDRFQKEGGGPHAPSAWFTVVCRLTQSFDLKGPTKENWICLEAQGSLAPGGTGLVYVAKDTPAGRLLTAKMAWGRVYLTDLLVGKMDIDGQRVLVVLDCAGTQPAGRTVR